jgi:hypothetical protein
VQESAAGEFHQKSEHESEDMEPTSFSPNRRQFILGSLGAVAGHRLGAAKKSVAAIVTEYRHLSHADVVVGRILDGYHPNGVRREPRTRIVSMYTDQVPANDMSRDLSTKHGFKIYPTIAETLTLGGERLGVDAVLLIGEHGNYPTNEKGQKLYPRFEMFQQVIEVFRRSGRAVPVFCDKHLSYSWAKAKKMYDQSRELRFPLMAGSSIPVTVRRPEIDLPLGSRIEHAVGAWYGGVEVYGFHGLEAFESLVERRAGAEKGIAAVHALQGEAVWKWRDGDEGRWSAPLLNAAIASSQNAQPGAVEQTVKKPVLFLLEYRDGFRGSLYYLDGHIRDFLFAAKLKGRQEPVATCFGASGGRPLKHFDGLVDCIEEMFVTGQPVYPVERTLLTSGALDFLMESLYQGRRIETPELKVEYRAPATAYFQRA